MGVILMRETSEKAVIQRIREARAGNANAFARRYHSPEEIARLAHHSSIIEGRNLSRERLTHIAREILEEDESRTSR